MPRTWGPFEIRGEIGHGAMAVVLRAWDPMLEREVAIKQPLIPAGLTPEHADELAQRFVREGRVAARLNHPGIVTTHAAEIYDGVPGIVMELVEGQTLGELLDNGPLTSGAAIAVLDQLLDAVGFAHANGVIHRDIKPDNVFIMPSGRVRLADFGIAHFGEGAQLTHAGTVLGTPGYMSPEQVTGAPVDGRSDLFAIGVLGYEMLTGCNPFGADRGAETTAVMYRIVHEPVDLGPLSGVSDVPQAVLNALSKAGAKNPGERFATAEEFRQALYLQGETGAGAQTGARVIPVAGAAGTPGQAPQVLPHYGASPYSAASTSTRASSLPYVILGIVAVAVLGVLVIMAGSPMIAATQTTPPPVTTPTPPPSGDTASGQSEPPAFAERDITYLVNDVWASSELSVGGDDFPASQVADKSHRTCWSEGVSGTGKGSTLTIAFADPVAVSRVELIPGYDKHPKGSWDRFVYNPRVKVARFEFEDGTSKKFKFKDRRSFQGPRFSDPVPTQRITITILDTYPRRRVGHGANDTSISEVRVFGAAQ